MDSIIVNLDCFLNSPCYYIFSLMETAQFDIGIQNTKPFELSLIHWRIYPLYFHHNILYKTKLQLRSTNDQNHCAQTLLIRLQRFPQHTSIHTHINYNVGTTSPVCRTQSSFSFPVPLSSLFGCLLFTYKLRRRGITVACF